MTAWRKGGIAVAAIVGLSGCASDGSVTSNYGCIPNAKDLVRTLNWTKATHINMRVRQGEFDPAVVNLLQGEPYILRFENADPVNRTFRAWSFFNAVAVRQLTINGVEQDETCISALTLSPGIAAEISFLAVYDGRFDFADDEFSLIPELFVPDVGGVVVIDPVGTVVTESTKFKPAQDYKPKPIERITPPENLEPPEQDNPFDSNPFDADPEEPAQEPETDDVTPPSQPDELKQFPAFGTPKLSPENPFKNLMERLAPVEEPSDALPPSGSLPSFEDETTPPPQTDSTEPSESETSEPVESEATEPGESEASEPSESETPEPSESEATEPSESETPEPSESEASEPDAVDTPSPDDAPSPDGEGEVELDSLEEMVPEIEEAL
jgi:hypothetical protein